MKSNHFNTLHVVKGQKFDKFPLNWDQIFHRKAPLAVEIGFGNGEFLVDWAKRRLDWNFIGIDYSVGSTGRLQKRLLQNSIENVRTINDDARFTLRELFSDNCIQHIIMNFPDPWPKKRHQERRILRQPFIQTLGAILKHRGVFELVTDQFWLAQNSHSLFLESHFLEVNEIEKNPTRLLMTKYEKKWLESGCEIYRVVCIKQNDSKVHRILEDGKMPNYIVKKRISPGEISRLKDLENSEDKELFVIKEIYRDFKKDGYLLRVITQDFDYKQIFYIVIAQNRNNWVIKLDDTSPIYRTPAVKMAINKLGEILSR